MPVALLAFWYLTNGPFGDIISSVTDGPVAQLGAHYIRIVGVGSSNLLRSTNCRLADFSKSAFYCHEK